MLEKLSKLPTLNSRNDREILSQASLDLTLSRSMGISASGIFEYCVYPTYAIGGNYSIYI